MSGDIPQSTRPSSAVRRAPQKEVAKGLIYRRVEPRDSDRILQLFRRVFQEDGTGLRSIATWRWRFESSPSGNQSCIAVERGSGRVVAHIGGTPHATIWDGEMRQTVECVDHMVCPDYRHGLGRMNLFARLKQQWYDEYCSKEASFLAWGFPSHQLFRVGQKYAGYTLARTINVLLCREPGRLERESPGLTVQEIQRFEPACDRLWARCVDELGCSLTRDRAYLNWRYADCPHQRYIALAARDQQSGALRGLAVLRLGGVASDVVMLMELLVSINDEEARRALLGAAARVARSNSCGSLVAWFPESTPLFEQLQEHGFRVRHTTSIMAARSWDPAIDLVQVRSRLYMSFGDMDGY